MIRSALAPLHVGLTGGIGSGKSTVGHVFAGLGAALLDADQIAHSVTQAGGIAMPAIAQAFGADYLDATGALDRARMRALVFSEPAARKQLEAIVHPLVAQRTQEEAQQAMSAGYKVVVFDIPLLVESGHWPGKLDTIVVVDCEEHTQVARTMARSALTEQAVQGIIASQASRSARRAKADAVIYNDGLALPTLHAQVQALARRFGL